MAATLYQMQGSSFNEYGEEIEQLTGRFSRLPSSKQRSLSRQQSSLSTLQDVESPADQPEAPEWRQNTHLDEDALAGMLRTNPPASRVANRLFVGGAVTPGGPLTVHQPLAMNINPPLPLVPKPPSPPLLAGRRAAASPEPGAVSSVRSRSELEAEVNRLRQEVTELRAQCNSSVGTASWSINADDLEILEQVGGGGYSLVYRGLWKGTPVAIKKWFNPDHTDEVMAEFRGEVMTNETLRHPNVVQFLGACMRTPNLCLVMEHLPHSLHSVLYTTGVDLDRKRTVQLAMGAARGMVYLHTRRPPVVHRDIKPANFLVDRAWHVKVCDFGLATNTKSQRGAGTLPYMAPELLQGGSYNEKVDVYAFGIMLNEMDTRRVPWEACTAAEIKQRVLEGERPDPSLSCPRALAMVIRGCWAQRPVDRPSFEMVVTMLQAAADTLHID